MKSKEKLNNLSTITFLKYKQGCEMCDRKIKVVYNPNKTVVPGYETIKYCVCRTCLKKGWEL